MAEDAVPVRVVLTAQQAQLLDNIVRTGDCGTTHEEAIVEMLRQELAAAEPEGGEG